MDISKVALAPHLPVADVDEGTQNVRRHLVWISCGPSRCRMYIESEFPPSKKFLCMKKIAKMCGSIARQGM